MQSVKIHLYPIVVFQGDMPLSENSAVDELCGIMFCLDLFQLILFPATSYFKQC